MQDGRVPGARTVQRSAVNAAMSSDFSVQAVAVPRAGSDGASEPKTATASEAPSQAGSAVPPKPIINPTLRLEPSLGLVVIEFHNDTGSITTSIPSQRQIEAYQRWDVTHFGPTPLGRHERVAATPARQIAQPSAEAHSPAKGGPTAAGISADRTDGAAAPTSPGCKEHRV
jgi:hypothetical protein